MRRTSTTWLRRRPRVLVARASPAAASAAPPPGAPAPGPGAGSPGSARSNSRSGLAGGSALRALDQRALELAPQRAARTRRRLSRGHARPGRAARAAGLLAQVRACAGSAARRRRSRRSPRPGAPNAAIASRARSRISPSLPARIASRICARAGRRGRCRSPPWKRSSREALLDGLALDRAEEEAVEQQRRTRAGPPGTWPASPRAPRGSPRGSVQLTSPSAWKASSSSEVPTATPSRAQLVGEARAAAAPCPAARGSGRPP